MLKEWNVSGPEGDNGGALVPVLSLHKYLSQEARLSIPPWQREYSWVYGDKGEGEVNTLLEDLKAFVDDKDRDEYLIGAVILCPSPQQNEMYVIDGQQRTVTFSLLMMCCLKYISKVQKDLDDYVFLTKLQSCFDRGTQFVNMPSVSFSQPKANEIMEAIRTWMVTDSDEEDRRLQDTEKLSQTQKNLLAVVKVFYKSLKDQSWIVDADLKPALKKIMDGVKVLQLVLDDERSAIEVYDRINNRGRHLSGGDLVKNLMFQAVTDDQFDQISENWTEMVQTLQKTKSGKLQDPTFLMRSIAWTLQDGKPTYDSLPRFFGRRLSLEPSKPDHLDPMKFADEISDSSDALLNFVELKHRQHGTLPELMVSQNLGSVQHYTVLLAGERIVSSEAFSHLYRQVARRTATYIFSQERPPEFETVVNKWAVAVRAAGPLATIEDLDNIFKAQADFKPAMVEQMYTNIHNWDYRRASDKKKIRAALALMSWWIDQADPNAPIQDYFRTKKQKGEKHGWDIDHIDARANEASTLSELEKNSFGNLVLLSPSDNRAAKNAAPGDDVKVNSYNHSKIVLTKTLGPSDGFSPAIKKHLENISRDANLEMSWNLASWNSQSVRARTEFYARILHFILVGKPRKALSSESSTFESQ